MNMLEILFKISCLYAIRGGSDLNVAQLRIRFTSSFICKITRWHFGAILWEHQRQYKTLSESFNAKKLDRVVLSRECQFYS